MRLRFLLLCFATPLGIYGQGVPTAPVQPEPQSLTPLTVCELLEDLNQYSGKMVAVVGRLSSSPLDGAWLSEAGCGSKVLSSDPNWPYAVFLGCFDEKKPAAFSGKLDMNADVLEAKLNRLRKTTKLEYYAPLMATRPGVTPPKVQIKETWSVAYGRIKPAPPGQRGWFGAVRAQACLCAGKGAMLYIEEPDPAQPK